MEIGIFRQENTDQVGVILEVDAVEIKGFALVPIGCREDTGKGRHNRFASGNEGPHHDPAVGAAETVVVIDDFQLLLVEPIDPGYSLKEIALTIHNPRDGHHLIGTTEDIEMTAMLNRIGCKDAGFSRRSFLTALPFRCQIRSDFREKLRQGALRFF